MYRAKFFVAALVALGTIAMFSGEAQQKKSAPKPTCDSLLVQRVGSDTLLVWVCTSTTLATYTFVPDTPGTNLMMMLPHNTVMKFRRVGGSPRVVIQR